MAVNQLGDGSNDGVSISSLFYESSTDGITAATTQTQAAATQLTKEVNRVTTSATAGNGVALPPALPGLTIYVINHGANAIQVYGNYAAQDIIDDGATGTGVSQMAGSMVLYSCTVAGKWYSEGLSTGFNTTLGLQTQSYAVIAASATDTQPGGTPIKSLINHVTSTGASQACTLPASAPGLNIAVALATASNAVDIFPASGDAINALGANTKLTMSALTSATFVCAVAGQWFTVPRVPS